MTSKLESKSAKWKNKWSRRQQGFSRNKLPPWKQKWVRRSAKLAKKFGQGRTKTSDSTPVESYFKEQST